MTSKEENETEVSEDLDSSDAEEETSSTGEETALSTGEERAPSTDEEELLLPRDTMLSAGIHIGTRTKTKDMDDFIYRVRPDGLYVLNVKKTDERLRIAAKFLSRFEARKVAAIGARLYARYPVKKFCEVTNSTSLVGRFVPGLLSNPLYSDHIEPAVIIVSDPKADTQAVKEAGIMGIPVLALCSSDNESSGVDFVIPTNNKGRRALAVIYWLLARQVLRERGELSADKEMPLSIDDFEAKISRIE